MSSTKPFEMKKYFFVSLLAACALAIPQTKTVKGGNGGFQYNGTANLMRFYGQNNPQDTQYTSGQNGNDAYNQGHYNAQSGYDNAQNGYNNAQSGYNNAQTGYNNAQTGYNNAQSGYNSAQRGYNTAQSEFSNSQSGFTQTQNENTNAQSGYNNAHGTNTNGQNNYYHSQTQSNDGLSSYNLAQGGYSIAQNRQGRVNTTNGFNNSQPRDFEVGVCYIEVPTVNLVRDHTRVPTGNGSRSDLSRIRSCCKGYVRNIHNFKLCEPVCTEECINGLCTAPDTCTCFPAHVRNAGGICIPTCPIGCQHGTCSGGECLCKPGYKLDDDSKYCLPACKDNCGRNGNCTAPDTCSCNKGYKATPSGGCAAHCDSCKNGDCVSPNVCRCREGYTIDQRGDCLPLCSQGCGSSGRCVAPNKCECPQGEEFDISNRQCRPKCTKACTNGECVVNNTCRCHHGYNNDATGDCVPVCSQGCGYGQCIAPEKCSDAPRPYDYASGQGSSQGPCSLSCINGVCSGNTCICNTGYQLDRTDQSGTRCIPVCQGGCPNGTCSAPNFCICNAGYVKDRSVKGHPACVKRSKRSVDQVNIADLLTYKIPDY